MINSLLVVCVGNICRSPVGAALLRASLPGVEVGSAGIAALQGYPADETMSEVAAENGVSLDGHVAQQFTLELGARMDLILVMEPGHKRELVASTLELGGRVFLFDHWTQRAGITDPYRKRREDHERAFREISEAAKGWIRRLKAGS